MALTLGGLLLNPSLTTFLRFLLSPGYTHAVDLRALTAKMNKNSIY